MTSRWPFAAVLGAAVLFGTTGTSQALAGLSASATSVGLARIVAGGALLALIAALARRGSATASARRFAWRPRSAMLIAVGAAGVVAYQPAFFAGTTANGVAVGTVVALGSAPVMTGVLNSLLTRTVPNARWLIGTSIAVVGVVLVGNVSGTSELSPAGLLGSVGAGAAYATYTVASKRLMDEGWSTVGTMGAVFGAGAAVSLPLLLLSGIGDLGSERGVALIAWLAVMTTAAAYVLFGWGLGRLSAPVVSTLTLAEPLTATLLGVVVLSEHIGTVTGIGLVVIAAGLAFLTAPRGVSASLSPRRGQQSADTAFRSDAS